MPVSCTLHTMTQGHFLNVYTVHGSLVPNAPCMRLTIYVVIQSPFNIAVSTLKKQYNITYIFQINYNQVLKVCLVKPTISNSLKYGLYNHLDECAWF